VFDPAVRAGSAAGRQRARTGDLARDAATAACGRPVPEQRRRKAAAARASMSPEVVARANRDRAARHLMEVASTVARHRGYPSLRAFVLARAGAGASLAAISREAGLHKDWLARHLDDVDPGAAAAVRQVGPNRADARLRPAVAALGFADVGDYLRQRHIIERRSVHAIGAEVGLSHHAVEAALARHGVDVTAHASGRHAAQARSADVAAVLGYTSMASYIADRRAAGWSWRAMSAESGQPATWLRRQVTAAG
jgi:lambda repressor-like predicted transcriptional regulator